MTDIAMGQATGTDVTGAGAGDGRGAKPTLRAGDVESARRESIVGGILVGITLLAALYFRWRPGPIFLDRWGFSLIHPDRYNSEWQRISELRSTSVLVGGSILSAVIVYNRDRWRALACLVSPTIAVALTEWVLKPEIARRYAQVLTYPSGTTTIVSGVVTAFVIAVPGRIRTAVIAVGAFVVALECMAVTALQWHFPTDALGGAIFGTGTVLLIDGILHVEVGIRRRRSRKETGEATEEAGATVPAA